MNTKYIQVLAILPLRLCQFIYDAYKTYKVQGNVFERNCNRMTFFGNDVVANTFCEQCTNIYAFQNTSYNVFGKRTSKIFMCDMTENTIGINSGDMLLCSFGHCKIGDSCRYIQMISTRSDNQYKMGYNILETLSRHIYLNNSCRRLTIGNSCNHIKCYNSINQVTIGNNCEFLYLPNNITSTTLGDYCRHIIFNENYYARVAIRPNNIYITFSPSATTNPDEFVGYITVAENTNRYGYVAEETIVPLVINPPRISTTSGNNNIPRLYYHTLQQDIAVSNN